LAQKEGALASNKKGNVEFYVRGNVLTFKRRDLSAESKRTFEYGDGNGIIKDVSVSYEDADNGASSGVASSGIDMQTGKPFKSKSTGADNKEATTGDKRLDFDVNSFLKTKKSTGPIDVAGVFNSGIGMGKDTDVGKHITIAALNKSDADLKTGGLQKQSAAKIMKLSITTEIDPTIESGQLITVYGLAQKHNGNWRIFKATHDVSSGGGESKLDCYRNGAKKSPTTTASTSAGKANTSQGNKEGNTTNKIRVYDENSKRLK